MILAIDLGSTSFKAGLFTSRLDCIGTGACELNYRHGPGGVVELDPAQVMDAVRQTVKCALAGNDLSELTAVSITSQAQTFAVVDSDGNSITPFISWLDTRAAGVCDMLKKSGLLPDFSRHASHPEILPRLQICKLRHLQDTCPDIFSTNSRVMSLSSFILYVLTGVHACDRNLAAMSGLYSMDAGTWWPAALDACGICNGNLPMLVDVGSVAGLTTAGAARLGLPAGLPVTLAGNDQTAGAYGAELHRINGLLITLGTCQVVYQISSEMPGSHRTTVAGPYPGGGWYSLAAGRCGGVQINWAKTVLAGCETDDKFFATAATAPPGCNGLIFEIGKNVTDNAWRHVSNSHGPGEFARSVLEMLTAEMANFIRTLTGGKLPEAILVAGGGSKSALWTGLLSEAIGRPLSVTGASPLLGAARMVYDAAQRAGN
jgi:sugar (pentulose or hexulose) kinase